MRRTCSGSCLMQAGDLERAEHFLNMASDFYRQTEMYPYLVRTLSSLAQLFENQQRFFESQQVKVEVDKLTQGSFTSDV